MVLDLLGLPENIKKIVMLILGLIFLLSLLGQLGIYGPSYGVYR
jgi:hypothetical protein